MCFFFFFFFFQEGSGACQHPDQGAGKRPRQCCPKGLKTKEIATRGPEGPEDEQNPVALASATICFSRFSQKSRFS